MKAKSGNNVYLSFFLHIKNNPILYRLWTSRQIQHLGNGFSINFYELTVKITEFIFILVFMRLISRLTEIAIALLRK